MIQLSVKKDFSEIVINGYFNPNSDSREMLIEAGIPSNIAQNIVKLRDRGKIFTKPEELKKIYGMSDSLYYLIESYIVLNDNVRYQTSNYTAQKNKSSKIFITRSFDPNRLSIEELIETGIPQNVAKGIVGYRTKVKPFDNTEELLKVYNIDSLFFSQIKDSVKIVKQTPVEIPLEKVEINTVTAFELIKASKVEKEIVYKIINYRNRLGGFYNASQIFEIVEIDSVSVNRIVNSIWLDTIQIKKLNLNQAEYKDLIKHPYFTKEKVSKVLRYRDFAKTINTFDELVKNKILTKNDIQTLSHYVVLGGH